MASTVVNPAVVTVTDAPAHDFVCVHISGDVDLTAERYVAAFEQAVGGSAVSDAVLRDVSEAAAAVGIAPETEEARAIAARLAEVDLGG